MRRELRTWVHTKKIRSRFANKNRKSCDETAMNKLRKIVMLAFGVLTVLTFQANSAAQDGAAPGGPAGAAPPGRAGRSSTPDHPHNLAPRSEEHTSELQ